MVGGTGIAILAYGSWSPFIKNHNFACIAAGGNATQRLGNVPRCFVFPLAARGVGDSNSNGVVIDSGVEFGCKFLD